MNISIVLLSASVSTVAFSTWQSESRRNSFPRLLSHLQAEDVQVEVGLQWCSQVFSDNLTGFVNSVKTIDGGTHLEGLKSAITRLVNTLGRKSKVLKEGDPNLSGDHVREGLSAIISVKVPKRYWPLCMAITRYILSRPSRLTQSLSCD